MQLAAPTSSFTKAREFVFLALLTTLLGSFSYVFGGLGLIALLAADFALGSGMTLCTAAGWALVPFVLGGFIEAMNCWRRSP